MTLYNTGKSSQELHAKDNKIKILETKIAKASEELWAKDSKIQSLNTEIAKINQDNKDLQINSIHDLENALQSQKDHLNKKHIVILQNYSERIKGKYKETFDKAVNFYESEIKSLKCLLESNVSRLDYKSHGLDLRKSRNAVVPPEASNLNMKTSSSVSHYRDRLKLLPEAGGLNNDLLMASPTLS